mmetsp:Transcript_24713/g.40440  ORF Transcript_24713/g.40440 Transcript_24713/m.40440 type:complete len:98 (-) Transcript_24713:98-391(-)
MENRFVVLVVVVMLVLVLDHPIFEDDGHDDFIPSMNVVVLFHSSYAYIYPIMPMASYIGDLFIHRGKGQETCALGTRHFHHPTRKERKEKKGVKYYP